MKTNPVIARLEKAYAAELETVQNYLAKSVWLDGLRTPEVADACARILSRTKKKTKPHAGGSKRMSIDLASWFCQTCPIQPTLHTVPLPMHTPNAIVIGPSFPPAELTGAHLHTYQTIFQHPITHNLAWHEVHALFRQLCQIEEEPNGTFKATRSGQTLVLSMPRTKDVAEAEDLMRLRDFLKRSAQPVPAATDGEAHWLTSINHHEARIFRSENHGTVAEHISSRPVDDTTGHAHSHTERSHGQEKHSYFSSIASALKEAGQILIVGSGTGTANEKEQFVAWLRTHHPELARRIVGVQTIDAHHITDDQLLAQARAFYARPHQPLAPRA